MIPDLERVLGHDHPDTLTSRSNLPYNYRAAGRLDEAIDLNERTVTDRERVLDTLTSRNYLANTRAARDAGQRATLEVQQRSTATDSSGPDPTEPVKAG